MPILFIIYIIVAIIATVAAYLARKYKMVMFAILGSAALFIVFFSLLLYAITYSM